METLETVLDAARAAAPYALFGISALCAGIALLNEVRQRRTSWEDDADCMYPGWRKLYENPEPSPQASSQTSPEPVSAHKDEAVSSRLALAAPVAKRVLTGLVAGAFGVEALFLLMPGGM